MLFLDKFFNKSTFIGILESKCAENKVEMRGWASTLAFLASAGEKSFSAQVFQQDQALTKERM